MDCYGMSVTDDRGPIDPRYVTYARYMRLKPSRHVTSSVTPYMNRNKELGEYHGKTLRFETLAPRAAVREVFFHVVCRAMAHGLVAVGSITFKAGFFKASQKTLPIIGSLFIASARQRAGPSWPRWLRGRAGVILQASESGYPMPNHLFTSAFQNLENSNGTTQKTNEFARCFRHVSQGSAW